jgi:hypothetical protein
MGDEDSASGGMYPKIKIPLIITLCGAGSVDWRALVKDPKWLMPYGCDM